MNGFPERRLSASLAGLIMAVSLWASCGFAPVDLDQESTNGTGQRWWRENREKIANVVLPLIAEHDTEFAAGYSEEIFDSLQLGASRDDVERLLGAPLLARHVRGREIWYYSRAKNAESNYLVRILKFESTGGLVERRRAFYMD